jgi:hypothetical protein
VLRSSPKIIIEETPLENIRIYQVNNAIYGFPKCIILICGSLDLGLQVDDYFQN